MPKDLLRGIVDRETGDLLDRKGKHVKKHGAEGEKGTPSKGSGADDAKGVQLALALLLLACSAGALVWSFMSMSSSGGGIRAYDPKDDVAGPDPTQTTKQNERVERLDPPNMKVYGQ
ncbi:MAG: hypothetical protein ACK54T_06290 [bacterium]